MRLVFWVCGGGHMFLSFSAFMNHTKRLGGQKNDHTTVFHPFDFARSVFLQFTKTKYRLQKFTFSLESRNTWENLNPAYHVRHSIHILSAMDCGHQIEGGVLYLVFCPRTRPKAFQQHFAIENRNLKKQNIAEMSRISRDKKMSECFQNIRIIRSENTIVKRPLHIYRV